MDFVRKKKRGQDKRVRRTWFSAEKYRIVWRKEAFGIPMPARFQASVRTEVPNNETWFAMWDHVDGKHHLYKTLRAAQDACEKHYRLWAKACEVTGIRALLELFGKVPFGIPVWAKRKLNRRVYALLTEMRPTREGKGV
jgi:hypothetical protein